MKWNIIRNMTVLALLTFGISKANAGFWSGIDQVLADSYIGNEVAISCHNCYRGNSLSSTSTKIQNAIVDGADLIELDIIVHNGEWNVAHDIGELGLLLEDVLSLTHLVNADSILFIEVKSSSPSMSAAHANDLVQQLDAKGYVDAGRPVIFRSFQSSYLDALKLSVQSQLPPSVHSNFKFSQLFGLTSVSGSSWKSSIDNAYNKYHMVEFNYKSKNLFRAIEYAKSLGLGVNIYTVNSYVNVFSTAFREHVDAITVHSNSISTARSSIYKFNNLFDINLAHQNPYSSVKYYDLGSAAYKSIAQSHYPSFVDLYASGNSLFGYVADFKKNNEEYIKFKDRDNDYNRGFFVSAAVIFNDLSTGPTQAIVNKSDVGAFALELHWGSLRFGVHVNGEYRYVNFPASGLTTNKSHHIVAAYDGSGRVRMWVDGEQASPGDNVHGGVKRNNAPITLGADPQGAASQQFFFDGVVQHVHVLKW